MATGRERALALPPPDRADYADRYTRGYDKCLQDFGQDSKDDVEADVALFLRDWRDGASFDDLYARYKFKELRGKDAKRYSVKQVWMVGDKYRIIMSIDNSPKDPCIYFLDSFKKQKDRQDADVDRGIERAKRFWSERNDLPG